MSWPPHGSLAERHSLAFLPAAETAMHGASACLAEAKRKAARTNGVLLGDQKHQVLAGSIFRLAYFAIAASSGVQAREM